MQASSLSVLQKVENLANQAAARHSCVVYDVELVGSGARRVLRVFIDKPGEGESVSIEDCSLVSQSLNLLLDVEDPIPGPGYNLEVSSPGLERKLKRRDHFESAVGQTIMVRCRRGFAEFQPELKETFGLRKQAEAVLKAVEDDVLVLSREGVEMRVPLEEVEKSHVVFSFDDAESSKLKPGKSPSPKKKKKKPGKGKR